MRRWMRRGLANRGPVVDASEATLDSVDRRLLATIDRDFHESGRRAGESLACAPGCSECCHGPFPVTRLDARRLRRGLDRMEREAPHRARAVRKRADSALEILRTGLPWDFTRGRLLCDEGKLDRYLEQHESLACPALEPGTGRCELYDWRPVSCRTFGPPLRFAGRDSDPCRLCFLEAEAETVEHCRMEPDPEGIEDAMLRAMGVDPGGEWETLIALVLAEGKG